MLNASQQDIEFPFKTNEGSECVFSKKVLKYSQ